MSDDGCGVTRPVQLDIDGSGPAGERIRHRRQRARPTCHGDRVQSFFTSVNRELKCLRMRKFAKLLGMSTVNDDRPILAVISSPPSEATR